jgi:hypothetical protein
VSTARNFQGNVATLLLIVVNLIFIGCRNRNKVPHPMFNFTIGASPMSKAKSEDIRPHQARPADGQTEHEGHSGFIPQEKFSDQGSLPYDGSDLEWPTRSGIQGASKVGTSKPVNEPTKSTSKKG